MWNLETRYGTISQAWWKGLAPALVVGVATYLAYRYVDYAGVREGYRLGTPTIDDYVRAREEFGEATAEFVKTLR